MLFKNRIDREGTTTVLTSSFSQDPDILADQLAIMEPEELALHASDLEKLLMHRSVAVRLTSIYALGSFGEGVPILRQALLRTTNDLVLSELCDVLGENQDAQSLPHLQKLAAQRTPSIVRTAAIKAIANISGEDALTFLTSLRHKRMSARTASTLEYLLLQFGKKEMLAELLHRLKSADYIVRCKVANYLSDPKFRGYRDTIIPCIRAALERETSAAVESSLRRNLQAFRDEPSK
jgi:HEAT repeat protein